MDLEQLLNKEQYEAAVYVDGPLLILAGAGSGKTRVLTYRIAHMIEDLHIYPSQILAITFTNKAAGEMKERVMALVGEKAENMWISTFHSSCVRILRREIEKIGYRKNFTTLQVSETQFARGQLGPSEIWFFFRQKIRMLISCGKFCKNVRKM